MKRLVLLTSLCALGMMGSVPVMAQELPWNNGQVPQPAPGPPIPAPVTQGTQVPVVAATPVAAQQTMYAVKTVNIRAGAGRQYNAIGKLGAGQGVAVAGEVPGGWFQLAAGGYVSASVLSPTPVVVTHRPPAYVVPAPTAAYYPVGACEPYSRVVNIGGAPHQINGTACKQPDGTWRIENYGVPVPAPGAVVEPAPIYATPPPVVYAAPPPPEYYHHHDPYWRY